MSLVFSNCSHFMYTWLMQDPWSLLLDTLSLQVWYWIHPSWDTWVDTCIQEHGVLRPAGHRQHHCATQKKWGVLIILVDGGSFVLTPWTSTQSKARLKVGLSDGTNGATWESLPIISCSFLLLPRSCRFPECRMRECVVCRSAFLSWRQRGHGGGFGRRLGHRAAKPQLRGGRPPPAPQCPMASRSQLLCCPSYLTSPASPICWPCSKGGEQRHMAQDMADATAKWFGCFLITNKINWNMEVIMYTPKQILGTAHNCENLKTPHSFLDTQNKVFLALH
jgi:hypothetical protein